MENKNLNSINSHFSKENSKPKKTIEERLKRYEKNLAGYEFIPAFMSIIEAYLKAPESLGADLCNRLDSGLKAIPNAKSFLAKAVELHKQVPASVSNQIFSRKYSKQEQVGQILADLPAILSRVDKLNGQSLYSLPTLLKSSPAFFSGSFNSYEKKCCDGEGIDQVEPAVPNVYELSFSHFLCIDESNPERGRFHDEAYVVFAVITEEMAVNGQDAKSIRTKVYEEIDDLERRPEVGSEGLRLYGFTAPQPIGTGLLVSAVMMEHDSGDPDKIAEGVRTALTAAAGVVGSATGIGWLSGVAGALGSVVGYIADWLFGDDQIGGVQTLSLHQARADTLTGASESYNYPE